MDEYILPLEKLIEQFGKLPGIGRKTAVRLAFSMIERDEQKVKEFTDTILEAKMGIKKCPVCFNLSEGSLCNICSDEKRDRSVICVTEDVRSLMSVERVKEYRGLYHILGGAISPIDGIGPDSLNIDGLISRIDGSVKEVILATNSTIEGETTAMYLLRILSPYNVKVSRLAYGMPAGGELEYTDEVTLFRALQGRRDIKEG